MNIIIISNPTAFCNIFSLCFLLYLYFFEKLSVSGCHFVRKFRKEDRFFDTQKNIKSQKKHRTKRRGAAHEFSLFCMWREFCQNTS